MTKKKKIWFDIVNVPQVHFQLGIRSGLEQSKFESVFTVRDFFETVKLFELKTNDSFIKLGNKYGKNKATKAFFALQRLLKTYKLDFDYDISISNGSEEAIITSWLKGRKSVAFGDNDTAPQWLYAKFVDYAFFPSAINKKVLISQGLKEEQIIFYDGFKEDIYIADYIPNSSFITQLPFNNYVLVRPENIFANYVNKGSGISITKEILKTLSQKGINILYLPKYDIDWEYAKGINNIYIPDSPINGLDACYYSDAVITGAGTLAREAACLGVPAFSFFAGSRLLAVDKKMVDDGRMFHSRDAQEIVNKVLSSKKHSPNLTKSINVKKEVIFKLENVIAQMLG